MILATVRACGSRTPESSGFRARSTATLSGPRFGCSARSRRIREVTTVGHSKSPDTPGPFGLLIQRFQRAAPLLLLAFPEVQGSPFDSESLDRGFEPVFLPEGEDAGFPLGFVGDHTAPAYGIVVEPDKAFDSVR